MWSKKVSSVILSYYSDYYAAKERSYYNVEIPSDCVIGGIRALRLLMGEHPEPTDDMVIYSPSPVTTARKICDDFYAKSCNPLIYTNTVIPYKEINVMCDTRVIASVLVESTTKNMHKILSNGMKVLAPNILMINCLDKYINPVYYADRQKNQELIRWLYANYKSDIIMPPRKEGDGHTSDKRANEIAQVSRKEFLDDSEDDADITGVDDDGVSSIDVTGDDADADADTDVDNVDGINGVDNVDDADGVNGIDADVDVDANVVGGRDVSQSYVSILKTFPFMRSYLSERIIVHVTQQSITVITDKDVDSEESMLNDMRIRNVKVSDVRIPGDIFLSKVTGIIQGPEGKNSMRLIVYNKGYYDLVGYENLQGGIRRAIPSVVAMILMIDDNSMNDMFNGKFIKFFRPQTTGAHIERALDETYSMPDKFYGFVRDKNTMKKQMISDAIRMSRYFSFVSKPDIVSSCSKDDISTKAQLEKVIQLAP